MNFKKIALAAAAAAAATPAMAADLPVVAEPVNYVQACDAFGAGYFQLPGKDTCIKLGGRIRTNFVSHDLNDGLDDVVDGEVNSYSAYARGYLYFNSMTNTEFASIKTYTEFTATHNQSDESTVGIGDVYLQLGFDAGSLLIGDTSSQFDSFTGYTWIAPVSENYSDSGTLQVSFTADLGNGFSAIASVEDANARGGVSNRVDLVGALAVSQGWGSAKLSGATHAYDSDNYGYAVGGSVTVTALEGIEASFQAQYASKAVSYVGGAGKSTFTDAGGVKGFNIGAGIQGDLSDTVSAQFDISYLSLEQGSADYDRTALDASIVYSPVAGLAFAVAAGWADDSAENKETKVGARVQYTF
ncbi:porin [Pseudovibrio sp. WM33]|uniref:porin n=1 Tax=Pseudovibrio sp. WM33 TaxID=1735585 RepID=UPI0007AE714C|nr:porin [Pseudovibrio sp. WM33]KZL26815.1 Porin omp2b precursor [Pseudovibrio sp. WM33]